MISPGFGADDPFLRQIDASGKKWVIFTDPASDPQLVLDAHHFLCDVLFDKRLAGPEAYWHRPICVEDMRTRLGDVIGRMQVKAEHPADDVVDTDIILVWGGRSGSSREPTFWAGCCAGSRPWKSLHRLPRGTDVSVGTCVQKPAYLMLRELRF